MHYIATMHGCSLLHMLSTKVRRLRRERGLTAREVAERSGLSSRFYAQLEAGRANISILRLARVAEALGTQLEDLLAEPADARPVLNRIALLGLRGAGKSTVGPRLADGLGIPFIELDERIEDRAGLALAEIFALHGEEYYRRLEWECLKTLIREDAPCIVAIPGGIVHNPRAFPLLLDHFLTVWLRARPEEHMQRVLDQGDRRPMANRLNAMAELRSILSSREPLYRRADLTINTSDRSPEDVSQDLLRKIQRLGSSREGP